MRRFIPILTTLLLSGCAASVDIMQPQQQDVDNRFVTDEGYDYAWMRAVDWFAESHITIDKLDKQSGIITAKHKLLADKGELVCGQVVGSGTYKILGSQRII